MRTPIAVLGAATLLAAFLGTFVPAARVLVAGMALLAPGFLLWEHGKHGIHLPRLASPAIMLGLSLSTIPIVLLWSTTLGLVLSPTVMRLLVLSCGLLAAWRLSGQVRGRMFGRHGWLIGGLLLVAILTFGLRLYQIRGVALPLWVDSVHHALLIRIIGETGAYPSSLQPYLEVDRIAYHWGYHAIAAAWQAAAFLPLASFMLLSGQVLNALHVLTVYALGAYLLRSPLAGLCAALATGLLSLMPAYYVTWGRYTQLTGLLLVPALIIFSCLLAEAPRWSTRLVLFTGVMLAGLFLVHYRVLIFYAAFMLAYLLLMTVRFPRRVRAAVVRLVAAGVVSLALAAPWVWVLAREALLPAARNPTSLVSAETYNGIDSSLVWTTNSRPLFLAAGIGGLFALLAGRWRVLAIAGWIGVMLLLANPNAVGLRPLWLINNHAVLITLFLPISLLAGYAVATALRWLNRRVTGRLRGPLRSSIGAGFVALACFGAWQFRDVVNPVTNLAGPADLPAIEWVAENTPTNARFLINAAPWLGRIYRGSDAGWWLTPLAGRWTSTPPSLYSYGSQDYIARTAQRSADVTALQITNIAELDRLIQENQITHIFVGSQGGPLKGEMFWGRPEFKPVYDHDGVLIFEVRRP